MHLSELKQMSAAALLTLAEEMELEDPGNLRRQELMFAILKQAADNEEALFGDGTLEVLQDGFGFLRSKEENYLPGPDDIYISPTLIRRYSLRTGDAVAPSHSAQKT